MNYERAIELASANRLNVPFSSQSDCFADSVGMNAIAASLLSCAYKDGFHGCFVNGGDSPEWASVIARYAKDSLLANSPGPHRLEEMIPSEIQGIGKGKRAAHWNHYRKLDPARALRGSQDYGNCTAWMVREMVGCEWGTDIVHRGEPHEYTSRPGTAVTYGSRGHSGQGSALATLIKVVATKGIQTESIYCDGKYDLRNENDDEAYGNKWGRTGPPSCILDEIRGNQIETWAYATEAEACMDVLYAGHFLGHGSMLTARTGNNLVSDLQSIGGHAQAWIGYDDTDEARDWVRQVDGRDIGNDWLAINDQSWGNWNRFPDEKWPKHLWGERPEGVWVVTGTDQMRIVRQWNDCIAISNVVGFPLRDFSMGLF